MSPASNPRGLSGQSPRSSVQELLRRTGADPARIAEADARKQLHLLAVDLVAIEDPPRYTAQQVADLTGLDVRELEELWVSFGFPAGQGNEIHFTQSDVEAFTNVVGLRAAIGINHPDAVALARVIGSATSRVAEAGLSSVAASNTGLSDAHRAERLLATATGTLPGVGRLLDYAWRRHFQATARRALAATSPVRADGWTDGTTVGFADLTGFTASSHQLTAAALEELVTHFAGVVHAVVHSGGGRVVKMIGDEVMFVVSDAAAGIRIGLDLVEAARADELLTEIKVGIACGPVLARDGDYFGSAVNAAARIAGITRPGAVVATDVVRASASNEEGLTWRNLHHCYLRGLGWVRLWAVQDPRSAATRPPSVSRMIAVVDELARSSLERMASMRGRVG